MKTPSKLSRSQQKTFSTVDRTAIIPRATLALASVAPSFHPTHPPPPIKHDLLPPPRTSPPANTTEFEKQIGKLISKDENISERNRALMRSGHSYSLHPLQSRLILAGPWGMPQRVRILYEEEAVNNQGRCEFKQGVLPISCLYYFAVARRVLFYDIGRAVQLGSNLEEAFMHECEFDSAVYQLKELQMKHTLFGQFKNRSIILVCCPWKFCFAALELQGGNRLQAGPRWMRITLLNPTLAISSQIASHIVEDDPNIYYLDGEGGVNKVSIEHSDWLDRLMGSSKTYKLSQATQPSAISSKALFVSRKATFIQKIQHYSKVVYAKATRFYGKKVKNYDLVIDNRRKMLYSLVDTNYNQYESLPSTYKLLTIWDTSNGKLVKKGEISEAELYEREIQSITNFSITANYRIVNLSAINPCLDSQANLMVVLECGIRLYVKADESFRVISYHLPPIIERTNQRTCEPKEHHKLVQMTHCSFQGSTALMNLKEEGDNHTFLIWKPNQTKQAQNCVEVTWGTNMSSHSGNPPLENYLTQLKLCLSTSKKEQAMKVFSARPTKSTFSGSIALSCLHQLCRDLFLPPTPFIHSTDSEIQYFCEVRPIDKVFSAVLADVRDQNVLGRIFEDLPCEELQFLLIQLFCDPEGLYLKDLDLVDCMTYYQRKVMQGNVENFDKFQIEFAEHSKKAFNSSKKRQRERQREVQPMYVGRSAVITAETEDKIIQMLQRLAKKGDGVGGRPKEEIEIHQSVCSSMLIYLSRLLRFLWKRSITDINSKVQALIPMIDPLHRIINYLDSPSSKSKAAQKKQIKIERLAVGSKALSGNPDISVSQTQPLVAMRRLISKITQLIILCSKVSLKLESSFSSALAMPSQRYESYLFSYLIDKYQHPTTALDVFKQFFPLFVGENLQKALRIYQESQTKAENQILAILKFHKKVPNYLLKYYQATGKIHTEDVRALRVNSSTTIPQKLLISSFNVKDGVKALMQQLKKSESTLQERNLLIVQLNSLLAHHLRINNDEDRFYVNSRKEMENIKKRLILQELIIQAYQSRNQTKIYVVNELKTSLFDENVLKGLLQELKVDMLNIVYTFMFEDNDRIIKQRLEESFKAILEKDYDAHESSQQQGVKGIVQKIRQTRQNKSRWSNLQDNLNSIVPSVRSNTPFQRLVRLTCSSILSENSTFPVISYHTIKQALPAISALFLCKDRQTLLENSNNLPFPLISILLWKVGSQVSELRDFYNSWLREESDRDVLLDQRKAALYHWLNMLCLSLFVQPNGEVFLYNSKKFIDNYLKRFPQEASLRGQLRELCKCFSLVHGLEELYEDVFEK